MRGSFARYFLGTTCLGLSLLMLAFVVYAAALREPYYGFGLTAILAEVLGAVFLYRGAPDVEPSRREAIIGVLLLWLLIPVVGAVPYWTDGGLSFLTPCSSR